MPRRRSVLARALAPVWVLFVTVVAAAQVNPRGRATMDEGQVEVEYGRPSAKGRDVLGMIRPDSYWRLGADSATTLQTSVPLLVGGDRVEPGEYTLLGHFVTSEEFFLVVARGMSGSRPTDVVARAAGAIERDRPAVELMTLELEGVPSDAALVVSWGESRIRVPIRLAP